jgi:GMP synthase-like glutamine amidotransferase
MRTLVIDHYAPNSPQIGALYEVLCNVTVHTVEVKESSTISSYDEIKYFDVIVLSGSQQKLSDPGTLDLYMRETDFLRQNEKPLLGICFGHQLLSAAFGSSVYANEKPIEGYYMINRVEEDEIFEGLKDKFLVMQSHLENVNETPYTFIKLADSPRCSVEMIKHNVLPIYGIQCHPERFDDKHPAGRILLENFFKLAAWYIT